MLKRVLIVLAVLALAAAAAAQERSPREILTVIGYGDAVFEPEMWRVAAAEEAQTYTSVLWRYREDEEVLFFFLYLHFDGGATEEAVTAYFSGDNLRLLLANYEPWRQSNTCTDGETTLYEFASRSGDQRWLLRYWVQTITQRRVLGVNAAVPEQYADVLDEYGSRLFPTLASCPVVRP